jgi:DNA-binding MarR family transcriptional regulator
MLEIFDSMCLLLAKAEQKHFYFTKKKLEASGLEISPGQMAVLYTLYKGDGISLTDLGKKIYLDNSTLTGLIDRLERNDLVTRASSPDDRRTYHIYLTAKAAGLQTKVLNVMDDVCVAMLEGCTQEEVATFRKVLLNVFNRLS